MNVADNLRAVNERIGAACQRANRSPDEVILVAVSKKKSLALMQSAYDAGVRHFGENRLEEATQKMQQWTVADVQWHMIGHVQSRKARALTALRFGLIHSLDSMKMATRYDRLATEQGLRLPVLMQVNVSGEATKSGWSAYNWQEDDAVRASLWHDIEQLLSLAALDIQGLMTMAPIVDAPEATRPVFRALAELRQRLQQDFDTIQWQHLSMGMTDDFEVAIEEGATIIRVGRAIFGERGG